MPKALTATEERDAYVATLIRRSMKTGRHPFPGDIAVTNIRATGSATVADVAATWLGVTVHYRARLASGSVTVTRLPNQKGTR